MYKISKHAIVYVSLKTFRRLKVSSPQWPLEYVQKSSLRYYVTVQFLCRFFFCISTRKKRKYISGFDGGRRQYENHNRLCIILNAQVHGYNIIICVSYYTYCIPRPEWRYYKINSILFAPRSWLIMVIKYIIIIIVITILCVARSKRNCIDLETIESSLCSNDNKDSTTFTTRDLTRIFLNV